MDVVTLGAALNGSKKYTDQVAQSLMGGVHYRGSVSYYADLPNDAEEGDSYTVKYAGTSGTVEDGTEYTWGYDTDSQTYAWISFSKDAYSKAETDVLLGGKQDNITAGTGLSFGTGASANTLNHSNTVTAKTTQALRKTAFDAQGHITGSSELSTAESNAIGSGIDSTKVAQIQTNKNSIDGQQNATSSGGNGYALINNIRLYVASSAPTGNIPDGSVGVGW